MVSGIRITLTAYTASFRVPSFVGHQLTLPVPSLATVYGMLSAAAGQWVRPDDVAWLAFRCQYEAKATDLEAIVAIERSKPQDTPSPKTRNVIQREFLLLPQLTLYLPTNWRAPFERPRYALLLGRTQDVAAVESMMPVTMEDVEAGQVSGVLLPLELVVENQASAWLHNLPVAFTDDPHRRLLGMRVFGVLDAKRPPAWIRAPGWLARDGNDGSVVPVYRQGWMRDVSQ